MLDSRYHDGLNKLRSLEGIEANPVDLTRFYDEQYTRTGNIVLLFMAGYINVRFEVDVVTGKRFLQDFIEKSRNSEALKELIEESGRLLQEK